MYINGAAAAATTTTIEKHPFLNYFRRNGKRLYQLKSTSSYAYLLNSEVVHQGKYCRPRIGAISQVSMAILPITCALKDLRSGTGFEIAAIKF